MDNCKGCRALPNLEGLSRLQNLEFRRCEFEDLFGLCILTSLEELDIRDCNKLEALPDLQKLVRLEKLRVVGCARLRDLRGILGLRNLKSLWVWGYPWLHKNLGQGLQWLAGLRSLDLSDGGFTDLQGLASCLQLRTLYCRRCPILKLPDLANFSELSRLDMRDCVNLTDLICSGPLCPNFEDLDVNGCKRLQSLPDFANSRQMQRLDVANSGVVLNAQLIQDMKARWPSIHLITDESSSQLCSRGSAQGIWRRRLGIIR